jgi:hypothetical protein
MSGIISGKMSGIMSRSMSRIMLGMMSRYISPNTQNKYDKTKHKNKRKT